MREPLDDLTQEEVRGIFSETELRTVEVPVHDLQIRESGSGDGSRVVEGYASVFDTETTLYEGMRYRWTETIARGAFDSVLAKAPDVHLNLGHDMNRAIARTKAPGPIGKLELSVDDTGLKFYARLNPDDPDVQALASKMDLGIMDQCSFAFRVKSSGITNVTTTDADGFTTDADTITEISELYDVCVCAQGAYPTTSAALRTLLRDGARAVPAVPASGEGAASPVPSDTPGATQSVERQKLLWRVARAKKRHKQKG